MLDCGGSRLNFSSPSFEYNRAPTGTPLNLTLNTYLSFSGNISLNLANIRYLNGEDKKERRVKERNRLTKKIK
jgi:hypothetical protein